MAFCVPEPGRTNKVPWIQNSASGDSFLLTDAAGNLCVKVVSGSGTSGVCSTSFATIEFLTSPFEFDLSTLLPANTISWAIYNTKPNIKEPMRLASVAGNALNFVEPYLDLGFGCVYENTCNNPLFIASDFVGHRATLEVVTGV